MQLSPLSILEHRHHPKGKPLVREESLLIPLPAVPGIADLLSVCIELPVMGIF